MQRHNKIPKFNVRRREENEPINEFIIDLYRMAKHCGYGELHDEMIRDRIVVGVRDRKQLQMGNKNAAVAAARQAELIEKQQTLLRSDFTQPHPEVEHVQKGRTRQSRPSPRESSRYGKTPAHSRRQCPAEEETCHKCQKRATLQLCADKLVWTMKTMKQKWRKQVTYSPWRTTSQKVVHCYLTTEWETC